MRFASLVLCAALSWTPLANAGGAACVMAKYQGETLDYALIYGKSHPSEAQEAAEAELAAVQAEVAAGSRAFSRLPSGAWIVSGRMAPSSKRMSFGIAWVANSASWLTAVVFGRVEFR